MKKMLSLLLVLILVPMSVCAAELDFTSVYTHSEMVERQNDAPFISSIQFTEDHVCYYCEQMFYPDRPGQSNAMVGTWEYDDNGNVVVKLGRSAMVIVFQIAKNGDFLMNQDTKQIYDRVNSIWTSR